MIILDGKMIADKITKKLRLKISKLNFVPKLSIIQVGDHPASNKYISYKIKKAQELNIATKLIKVSAAIDEASLITLIQTSAAECDGLIVQLPLPKHINKQNVLNAVPFNKDIDGLAQKNNLIIPATPQAIIKLLQAYNFELKNQVVAVVGQSNLVGKPTADLCEQLGVKTVYRIDKKTGLKNVKLAAIVIVAIGQAKYIKAHHLKTNAVVIDVGINEIADPNSMRKIVGDVDADDVKFKVKALSPVPGGVGPMTIICLLDNLLTLCSKNNH